MSISGHPTHVNGASKCAGYPACTAEHLCQHCLAEHHRDKAYRQHETPLLLHHTVRRDAGTQGRRDTADIGTQRHRDTYLGYVSPVSPVSPPPPGDYLGAIMDVARQSPLPPAAEKYHLPGVRLLVALCYQLQLAAGDRPWYLGCRDAGRLLGVPFQRAAKWIRRLVADAVVARVSIGTRGPGGLASQYRYLGGQAEATASIDEPPPDTDSWDIDDHGPYGGDRL